MLELSALMDTFFPKFDTVRLFLGKASKKLFFNALIILAPISKSVNFEPYQRCFDAVKFV